MYRHAFHIGEYYNACALFGGDIKIRTGSLLPAVVADIADSILSERAPTESVTVGLTLGRFQRSPHQITHCRFQQLAIENGDFEARHVCDGRYPAPARNFVTGVQKISVLDRARFCLLVEAGAVRNDRKAIIDDGMLHARRLQ